MSVETTAAVGMIVVPVLFNVMFGELARTFDYPDILRRPSAEVLGAFSEGGTALVLRWWLFMLSAVMMVPVVLLVGQTLPASVLMEVATFIGVLAAVVQFLGLVRWPFAVPYLARAHQDSGADASARHAVELQFQVLNRLQGVGIGEHLGYLFTGTWTICVSVAMLSGEVYPTWLGFVGLFAGAAQIVGSLEFVGPNEPKGWSVAEKLVPPAYIVWSLWLVAGGIALLV